MNPYNKDTRIYELYEQIRNEEYLKKIFMKKNKYESSHLNKCVTNTKKYPFLNEYIEEYLKLYPEKINVLNDVKNYPLNLASSLSRDHSTLKTIEILLKHGANTEVKDYHGRTPLFNAVWDPNDRSTKETIEILLKCNANPNAVDELGNTMLSYSIFYDDISSIKTSKILLKYNADVNIALGHGLTLLMITLSGFNKNGGIEKNIKLLLKYGADINAKDIRGYTAITYAIRNRILYDNEIIFNTLLKHGADIDIQNIYGGNALTLAIVARSRRKNVIDIILPKRKMYIEKILKNEEIIMKKHINYYHKANIDYKLLPFQVFNFINILDLL